MRFDIITLFPELFSPFVEVGVMRSVGWKFGRWLDIVMMEKTLGDGDHSAPTT